MNGHRRTSAPDMRAMMEDSLEVLRIYRHDLMNQVQLLQAYSQLKKYERLNDPIQALVKEAQRHTEWSAIPSSMVSYVVLSRDIKFQMLQLHVSYEQQEEPTEAAEWLAVRLLGSLLDSLGETSKTLLEPLPIDVWIVSFRQGYEIGWFADVPHDWAAWAMAFAGEGVELVQEPVEDGIEYRVRFQLQE
ncbi:Spo0B domain-containing protein [Tumebacillus permanentifrigoris]|uniref:Sensor kinase SpoOB-type protein n=1 Tax=Tumebacillus permanentifrigoris TaxID=378543 RepID=A0A316D605_9BACL|nr:Spo0B domain-containing protein [Tumebacillus permanentifrigoris]PWK06276.1 sensor kinase SpoOB-type protein [Tumebacillus permanentifrigoris]